MFFNHVRVSTLEGEKCSRIGKKGQADVELEIRQDPSLKAPSLYTGDSRKQWREWTPPTRHRCSEELVGGVPRLLQVPAIMESE
ncbi:hypothetical protein RRG08_003553 [Elysia crispata]|uniref:Uncharacterized protein n=1 Tax=Elysia crispata TaxID=231223 RepID=A0AAE0Y868_9GAST|nr:hypothetical protein RRG08_003553 [Elysia crispata]